MLNRVVMRCIGETHKFWYRLTGGRIGGRFGKVHILLLTTCGRKTGRPRTTPLSYLEDNGGLVVIASSGGSDRHPAWYLNLRAQPTATVKVRDRSFAVTAQTASPEEKARLWPAIVEIYRGYEDYQRRTKRDIPVVILRPEK